MPEQLGANWTIERVELVLFNLEHKRWQIWWEHSLANLELRNDEPFPSGALYRRQIIRLLDNARQMVSAVVAGPFVMAARPREETALNPIRFAGEQPTKAFWPLFLKYCHDTCTKYGIHSQNVKAFLNDPDALSSSTVSTAKLTRDDAADIVAAIPIAANWDLFGCWHRCWTDPGTHRHFPPSDVSPHSWSEPFYIARIYKTEDVLKTEAICGNLPPGARPVPAPCGPGPFFSNQYCYLPASGTPSKHTYDAYAFLYDNLHKAMGFTATTYIVSYPILVYDRIHFLQFQVSGGEGQGLRNLWDDWLQFVHDELWTTQSKTFFQEALQQLLLAYFESRWTETLSSQIEICSIRELPTIGRRKEDLIRDSFAATGNLLVPLKALTRTRTTYSYRPFTWSEYLESTKELAPYVPSLAGCLTETPDDSLRNGLGSTWDKSDPRAEEDRSVEVEGCTIVPARAKGHSEVARIIATARVGQLLDTHGSRMRIQFGPLRGLVESTRYASLEKVRQHFDDAANREAYSNCSNQEEMIQLAQTDRPPNGNDSTVWMHLQLAFGRDEAESIAELRRLCRRKLPGVMSDCFSVGSLKGVTHEGLWTGTQAQLLSDLSDKFALVENLLETCPSNLRGWLEECSVLIEAIKTDIAGGALGKDFVFPRGHPLTFRFKMLRWPHSDADFSSCTETKNKARAIGWKADFGVQEDEGIKFIKKRKLKAYFPVQQVLTLNEVLQAMKAHARDHNVRIAQWRCADPDQECRRMVIGFHTSSTKLWSNVLAFDYIQEADEEGAADVAAGLMKHWTHFVEDYGRMFVQKGENGVECVSLNRNLTYPPIPIEALRRVIRPPEGEAGKKFLSEFLHGLNVKIFLVWQVWEETPPVSGEALRVGVGGAQ